MKNNIDIREWKYFYLKDIFLISKGKRLTKEDSLYGDIPFITAGEENLGVSRYVGNDVEKFSNSITIDIFGFSQYRDFVFACDDNIIVLKLHKNDSKYIYNFISTIINCDKYRMSYGRQYRLKILENHKIKLPSKLNKKNEYEPDWEYMENYIKTLYMKIQTNVKTKNIKNDVALDKLNWINYTINELFNIYTGEDLILNEVEVGNIPIVSHSENNCGVNYYSDKIENRKLFNHNNCLSLADRGLFKTFTQQKDFYIGTRVKALELKEIKNNKYILLFLSTIINNEIWRFNYGRNATDKLPQLVIKLPSKLNEKNEYEPDWEYMENYIKSLPYGDII